MGEETGVRLAICDSLSLAIVVLLNDLGGNALESQNCNPDPGFDFSQFTIYDSRTANPPALRQDSFASAAQNHTQKASRLTTGKA